MAANELSEMALSSEKGPEQSTYRGAAPRLTHRGLTILLIAMCMVPTITIGVLWTYLPRVYEGQLAGSAWTRGMPGSEFYALPFRERQPVSGGILHVRNDSEQPWTMLNVQINGAYQIYDRDALAPGEVRAYELNRFVTLTGAAFNMRYNPVRNVRVYARLPTKDRATCFVDFEDPALPLPDKN